MAYEVYLKCDRCGISRLFPDYVDHDAVLIRAEKIGWDVFTKKEDGTYDDICHECKKKKLSNNG